MPDDICTDCGRVISAFESPCILEQRVVCRECHDRIKPICPYCGRVLTQRPRSQSACPHCGKKIVVRTAQRVFSSIYLTVDQAKEADQYRSSTPASYGCGQDDFAATKRELERRLGRDVTAKEVIAATNDRVPATDAQLAYATGAGLKVPANPTKNELSWRLYCFESLKWQVKDVLAHAGGGETEVSDLTIGEVVSAVLEDAEFMQIIRASRFKDFADASRTERARTRLAEVLEIRGSQNAKSSVPRQSFIRRASESLPVSDKH